MAALQEVDSIAELTEAIRRAAGVAPGGRLFAQTATAAGFGCSCGRSFTHARHACMHRRTCLGGGGLRYLQHRAVLTRPHSARCAAALTPAAGRCVRVPAHRMAVSRGMRNALQRKSGVAKIRITRQVRGADVGVVADLLAGGRAALELVTEPARDINPRRRWAACTLPAHFARHTAQRRVPVAITSSVVARVQGDGFAHAQYPTRVLPSVDQGCKAPDKGAESWES
eukprot:TRINITY_DN26894_c0_g1_i1.p1 TRINITY_DN26894_c0_g1~~TRINITY_DN26894_c0_g1_i1.p1  ORF type:complete len:257 (+),score=31.51 TRINITY_DN26894_c0_g1_i1:92-772(+)